ncbi:MAG: hypothetical protein ACREE6_14965 [Limisphaerales bacterium]
MKKIFTHDNLVTFGFVVAAVTVAALVFIPLAKKFIPASLLAAVAPAATTATTTA